MKQLMPTDPIAVGPYRPIAELGRGGMGRVLLSTAPDGRLVALKQVHQRFLEDDGFRARFRREVEAARSVTGTYTSTVVDADPDAPEPWLTSDFIPGLSLHEAVETVGALPAPSVLSLATGLATALADVHHAGLVHRDIKPSNVLLAEDGPRLIDFGIARAADSEDGTTLTHTGLLVGSPAFMSPEQAQGLPTGPPSDVFSLGAVLLMAYTGACPFIGPSIPQTLYNIVYTDPDLGRLPEEIQRIAAPCLAKDPGLRPSADSLLDSLTRLAAPVHRPWPVAVHELIEHQRTEVARLRAEAKRAEAARTEPKRPAPGAPAVRKPAPRKRSGTARWELLVAGAITAALAVTAGVLVPQLLSGGGTREVGKPVPVVTQPPLRQTTPSPTAPLPSPTVVTPKSTPPPVVVPSPTVVPERTPTPTMDPERATRTPAPPPDTKPSTQPALIASCYEGNVVKPTKLLLACGDGKLSLLDLTWSGWGTPTATATGTKEEVPCVPSCAQGRPVHAPAKVTVTGLVGGRYTRMQIDSPRSPNSFATYRLGPNGPVSLD